MMNKKLLIASIFTTLMLMLPMTSVVGVSDVEEDNQISNLNPPQPSPIRIGVDFNITFYQPSSLTIEEVPIGFGLFPPILYIGKFFVIDFLNSPVGRIKNIQQSTGAQETKTFTYFMLGFIWTKLDINTSHYNKSTGLGYITGTESLLFYFGL